MEQWLNIFLSAYNILPAAFQKYPRKLFFLNKLGIPQAASLCCTTCLIKKSQHNSLFHVAVLVICIYPTQVICVIAVLLFVFTHFNYIRINQKCANCVKNMLTNGQPCKIVVIWILRYLVRNIVIIDVSILGVHPLHWYRYMAQKLGDSCWEITSIEALLMQWNVFADKTKVYLPVSIFF